MLLRNTIPCVNGKCIFSAVTSRRFLPLPAVAVPSLQRTAVTEYGGYLTQHVGLCAECHTPRGGLMQKPDKSRLFAGKGYGVASAIGLS